jgi:hypothetical protein
MWVGLNGEEAPLFWYALLALLCTHMLHLMFFLNVEKYGTTLVIGTC